MLDCRLLGILWFLVKGRGGVKVTIIFANKDVVDDDDNDGGGDGGGGGDDDDHNSTIISSSNDDDDIFRARRCDQIMGVCILYIILYYIIYSSFRARRCDQIMGVYILYNI